MDTSTDNLVLDRGHCVDGLSRFLSSEMTDGSFSTKAYCEIFHVCRRLHASVLVLIPNQSSMTRMSQMPRRTWISRATPQIWSWSPGFHLPCLDEVIKTGIELSPPDEAGFVPPDSPKLLPANVSRCESLPQNHWDRDHRAFLLSK